jgi:hypothetical protein
MGMLGLVWLILAPWTGVVLVLIGGTGIAYNLLPWESWLPRKQPSSRTPDPRLALVAPAPGPGPGRESAPELRR